MRYVDIITPARPHARRFGLHEVFLVAGFNRSFNQPRAFWMTSLRFHFVYGSALTRIPPTSLHRGAFVLNDIRVSAAAGLPKKLRSSV